MRVNEVRGEETLMSNGEQGETVTVQDRPIDDADVENTTTDVANDSSPGVGGPVMTSSEASSTDSSVVADSAPTDGQLVSGTEAAGPAAPATEGSADAEAPTAPAASRSSRGSVRDLEEEGEVAADYLEELLDIVDVDGDIDIDVENGRASLAIVAEGGSDRSLRRLVGSNGEVLEALQELTRLAVQASTGERSRLMLDIAGHRAHRRKVLTESAAKACQEVKRSGKPLSLDPMSAFERKIVHDVVADAGLNSESEGVDPQRHVVILPASA
jgi:spoIIIJ-associated protein